MLNSLMFFVLLSTANAEEFTILAEDQPAPFEGVLLSVPASAEVLSQYEQIQMECDLELEFQLDKAGTQYQLEKDLLQARITTLDQEYAEIVAQKDLVIEEQKKVIKKQSPQYKWLWFAGGVLASGATYYGINKLIEQ